MASGHFFKQTVSAPEFQENGTNLSSKYLGINAQAVDSLKLGGVAASGYSLSGHTHNYEPAFTTLPISKGGTGLTSAASGAILIGPSSGANAAPTWRRLASGDIPDLSSTYSVTSHNHNTAYLGINATASDSSKLGGVAASGYALSGHNHNSTYLSLTGGSITGFVNIDSNQGTANTHGLKITYPAGGGLAGTEFAAVANRTGLPGNLWTAMYAKQGSAGSAGYFDGSLYATTIYENGTAISSKFAAVAHDHTRLLAVDDRDVKPNDTNLSGTKAIGVFFTTFGGMTGVADTNYQDLLVLDTYHDTSGGNVNALLFDKDTMAIRHYQAAQGATTWGTPKTLAYLESPAFSGTPTAPTAAAATNTTQIATTAYVKSQGYTTNTGTVTSVGLSLPSIFTVTGSPVTTSGTLTAALANASSGFIFAGPSSGAAAAPTFRALVAADIPSLDAGKVTTGTLSISRGGTGTGTAPTQYGVIYASSTTAYASTAAGGAAQILLGGATVPTWQAAPTTAKQVLTATSTTALAWNTLDLTYLPDAWVKKSVRVATTANITLSGTQTIDGVAVVANDRVLVKNQSTASQNGIYQVAAGAWTRVAGADTAFELAGATVSIDQGTANFGKIFTTTFKSTDTVGTTACNWYEVITSSGGTFTGGINGTGATFSGAVTAGGGLAAFNSTGDMYATYGTFSKGISLQAESASDSSVLDIATNTGSARFRIGFDGKHGWTGNGSTWDTNLYRASSGVVKTDGYLTQGGLPMARIFATSDQSLTGNGYKGINLDSTTGYGHYLKGGFTRGSFARGTYLVIPVSGYYRLTANVMFNNISGGYRAIAIALGSNTASSDGDNIDTIVYDLKHSSRPDIMSCNCTATCFLTAGQRVWLLADNNADSVTAWGGNPFTFLEVFLVNV